MKVIIVGGGLCGLYLAYQLKNINIDFEIHEKSSRPGGRIKSIKAFNKILECGAHLIQPYHFNILSLLAKLKINTSEINSTKVFGLVESSDQNIFNTLLQKIKLSFERDKPTNILAKSYIKSILSEDEFYVFHLYLMNETNLNTEISDFMKYSFYDLKLTNQVNCHFDKNFVGDKNPNCTKNKYITINGGMQVLTDRLAQLVQEKLYLNSPVTAITHLPITNSYMIEANGRLINADYVVLATDASIKTIRLSIPKEIKQTIQSVSTKPIMRLYTLHANNINLNKTLNSQSLSDNQLIQTQNVFTNIQKVDTNIISALCTSTMSDLLYNLLVGKDKSIISKEIKKILHKLLENITGQELPKVIDYVTCKWQYGEHYNTKKITTNYWAKYNLILAGEWVHPYHNTLEGSVISANETFNIITKDLFKDKLKHNPDNVNSIESNRTPYVDYPVKTY